MAKASGPADISRPAPNASTPTIACRADNPQSTQCRPAITGSWLCGYAYAMWGPGLPGRLDAVEDARAAAGLRRMTHADRIAARIAEFERCAADLAKRMGRPTGYVYTGGPVAWEPS